MSKPKGPDGADPMAAAEGQAAVEAIAETEGQPGITDPKPRRRKPKAVEDAAEPESPASTDASIAAAGAQTAAMAAAGSDLVPVMAPEETVRAESVTITQGGASHVEAGTLSVTQGGVGDARADRIEVRQGGVGRAEVDELVVTQGGVGIVRAEHASISQAGAGAVIGDRIDLHQSAARLVIARGSVQFSRPSRKPSWRATSRSANAASPASSSPGRSRARAGSCSTGGPAWPSVPRSGSSGACSAVCAARIAGRRSSASSAPAGRPFPESQHASRLLLGLAPLGVLAVDLDDLAGLALGDDAAVLEQDGPIAVFGHPGHVMGDQDDRPRLLDELQHARL